jgi:gliding motility-associated lipoprotein GldH
MRKLLAICLLCFLAASCGRQPIQKFETVDQMTWQYKNPYRFTVAIKQPGAYRLYLQLRYTQEYNFSNIWVGLMKKDPDGKEEKTRFNIPLFDVQGRPYGSFAGKFFDRSFPDAEVDGQKLTLNFDKPGQYTLTLQHNMRADNLKGLREVGIRLQGFSR